MKRENIILRKLKTKVILGSREIEEIYFDLIHINYGRDTANRDYNGRSPRGNFTEEDIVYFFEQLNSLVTSP